MKTILFQGDSITDVGRQREEATEMGRGYPLFISAHMGFEHPGEYAFLNRGVSGDRIVDVYARIKIDIINLKPDVMSLLIGINDVWSEISRQNGVGAEKFERLYDMLLTEVRQALPDIRLLLLEPFVLKGTATEAAFDTFKKETPLRSAAVKRLAKKHGAVFVPLQAAFDEAAGKAPPDVWLWDGVHPTSAGHEIIKREWLKAF